VTSRSFRQSPDFGLELLLAFPSSSDFPTDDGEAEEGRFTEGDDFTFALIRSAHPSGYPLVVYLRSASIPQLRTRSSTAQTAHLPPELNDRKIGTAALFAQSLPVPALPTLSASNEVSVRRLAALIHSVHLSRGHPPGALTPHRSGSHSLSSHGPSRSRNNTEGLQVF
jgi:hypothetical protein